MYAKRNSLTILAVLLLLSGLGYLWYRHEAKKLTLTTAKNKQLSTQLRGSLEVAETLALISAERDQLQQRWQNAPKKLLNAEEPAFSLSYVNWLINQHNLDLDFDFYLNEKKASKEYTAFSYTLSGEGDYYNVCALIWYMTRSPLLYQIKSVDYRRNGQDSEKLKFTIMFQGFSMNKDWEVNSELTMVSQPLNWAMEFEYDAFNSLRPVVVPEVKAPVVSAPPKPVKPPEPPGLVDAETATLLSIAGGTAYVRARDGKVVPMRVGQQVKRGNLTRIDPQANTAEFTLESDNGPRVVRLKIEYN
jgi:Tfp pilus assembly protein PilO